MRERTRDRDRDRRSYEFTIAALRAARDRSWNGKVVVRGKGNPFWQDRQALLRQYLHASSYIGEPVDTALDGWKVFMQVIRKHSGKHRHQGGLVIYIIEGAGHTIVDGERLDWESGDLLLLPIRPGGCEHQHFNRDEEKPVKWIAFIHTAIYEWCASEMVPLSKHPDFQDPALKPKQRR